MKSLLRRHTVIVSGIILTVILSIFLFTLNLTPSLFATQTEYLPNQTSPLPTNPQLFRQIWSAKIKQNPSRAYEEFKVSNTKAQQNQQHNNAHLFGRLLYQVTGIEGIAICDPSYSFGCYHSFFGEVLSELGMDSLNQLDVICIEELQEAAIGCQHGIGHGLLEYLGHDKLVPALEACSILSEHNELFGCTAGVFMEYNLPLVYDGEEAYTDVRELDKADPYAPCPSLPKAYQVSCYHELPQLWSHVFNNNFDIIGTLCNDIKEDTYKTACFDGIGSIAGPTHNYNSNKSRALCNDLPSPKGQITCLIRASWSYYAIPEHASVAGEICKDIPEKQKGLCAI